MAEGKTLSAVIPNYNHGALIGHAIRAMAEQERPPDEIIVIDDASTDNSLSVLNEIAAETPMLRVVSLAENGGAIAALNRGLAEATGDIVYFGAADDLVLPGLFADGMEMLERYPDAAFACSETRVVDQQNGAVGYRPPARPCYGACFLDPAAVERTLHRIDNWILTGTCLVRRELLRLAGGLDPELGAFADSYALRRLALIHGCCFSPRLGHEWRVYPAGVSRALASDAGDTMRILEVAVDRMRNDPAFPDWYLEVFRRRWRFAVGRIAAVADPMNLGVLIDVCARNPVSRMWIKAFGALGGAVGRLAILGGLTLLERPTSIFALLRTAWSRRRLTVAR